MADDINTNYKSAIRYARGTFYLEVTHPRKISLREAVRSIKRSVVVKGSLDDFSPSSRLGETVQVTTYVRFGRKEERDKIEFFKEAGKRDPLVIKALIRDLRSYRGIKSEEEDSTELADETIRRLEDMLEE